MYKSFFFFIAFFLESISLAAEKLPPNFIKLSDTVYVAKQKLPEKRNPQYLYYVLEKITPENYIPWKESVERWITAAFNTDDDHLVPIRKPIIDSLRRLQDHISFYNRLDVWIAYISPEPITNMQQYQEFDIFSHAIMTLSISAQKEMPLALHMGILRSLSSLKRPEDYPKNISCFLHSFAACVIKHERPDIYYSMSFPLEKMEEIFEKNIPSTARYIYPRSKAGRPFLKGPFRLEDTTLNIYDMQGKKLISLPNALKEPKYGWFTRYFSGIHPLYLMDINALAKIFPKSS